MAGKKTKRKFVSQKDIPAHSLTDSLKIPEAIFDNYAGDPTEPIDVAAILGQAPKGSAFKMLSGAAIAYGLVDGGAQSETISVTELSERIFRPTQNGEDISAKREAFLRPRIINEFLNKYDKSPVPTNPIAINVIEKLGVPRERAADVFSTIIDGAKKLGLVKEINGKTYIRLLTDGQQPTSTATEEGLAPINTPDVDKDSESGEQDNNHKQHIEVIAATSSVADNSKAKRVFITHGKNKTLVEPIKQLLAFGELEPVVSVELQSVSKPVPEKVMGDMRSCGAAIIHVEGEETLLSKQGDERTVLNPNVLIEIGAAMALYGRRFILLVKEGTTLPSNLQGLYEVRYSDDKLDGDATIRLLKAINDMKNTKSA